MVKIERHEGAIQRVHVLIFSCVFELISGVYWNDDFINISEAYFGPTPVVCSAELPFLKLHSGNLT